MGKVTGFLEIDRQDRKYKSAADRVRRVERADLERLVRLGPPALEPGRLDVERTCEGARDDLARDVRAALAPVYPFLELDPPPPSRKYDVRLNESTVLRASSKASRALARLNDTALVQKVDPEETHAMLARFFRHRRRDHSAIRRAYRQAYGRQCDGVVRRAHCPW